MSTYIGIPSSNKQAAPEFSRLGENFRKAVRVSELGLRFCLPVVNFFAAGFLSLIPYLIISAYQGYAVPINSEKIVFSANVIPYFEDIAITLVFAFNKAISAELIEKLKLVEKRPGGKYTHGYVTTNRVKLSECAKYFGEFMKKEFSKTYSSSSGVQGLGFSSDAALALIAISRVVNGFLHSQTPNQDVFHYATDDSIRGFSRLAVEEDPEKGGPGFELSMDKATARKATMDNWGVSEETSYDFVNMKKLDDEHIFFKASDIPEEEGHCFPFVPGVIPADESFFATLLYNHFSTLFSRDSNSARTTIEKIVSSLHMINSIAHGKALIFLLYLISLTITCNGRLIVIREETGRVLGAVIYTSQRLWAGNVLRVPVDADSIRSTVQEWISSSTAREEIASLLSDLELRGKSEKKEVKPEDIDTIQKLLMEIALRKRVNELSPANSLAIRCLGYDFSPLPASSENIAKALTMIKERKLPTSTFVNDVLFTKSDLLVSSALSVFGASSISFMNPNGKTIELYEHAGDDPLHKKKKKVMVTEVVAKAKGKKALREKEEAVFEWDRICVSRVDIETAYEEFYAVLKTRKICQTTAYDSKVLGNIDVHPFAGGEGILLTALRLFGGDKDSFPKKVKVAFEPADLSDEEDEAETENLLF